MEGQDGDLGREVHRVRVHRLTGVSSPRISGADADHVKALAGLDVPLPPVVVHRATMRVLDGVHRIHAAVLRGEVEVEVHYFDGSEDEAFILAVRLNSAHGKPLSFSERAAAAKRIITSHPHWSDRRIAGVTYLAPKTVAALRGRSTADDVRLNKRVGMDGRARPVNPAEGRLLAAELLAKEPEAPLRRIAQQVGISLATVSDVRHRMLQGRDVLPPRLRHNAAATVGSWRQTERGEQAGDERTPRSGSLVPDPDVPAALGSLRSDPSMRLSGAGRSLLRLLSIHPSEPAEWQQLVRGVPPHRVTLMARVARSYAQAWLQVAQSLEQGS
ncbi:ParB N-terminal domain-containing protein [Streptomyces alanosinicus]|uniref:ParB N-terminal domain-containing protein n=1 Tax=Streptomyces alanosinicus TaxID=68171 RepID=UPI0016761EDA|nr:ParB N-terminal domain-containing protein [Streptomyces alanosinicus]